MESHPAVVGPTQSSTREVGVTLLVSSRRHFVQKRVVVAEKLNARTYAHTYTREYGNNKTFYINKCKKLKSLKQCLTATRPTSHN